MSADFPPPRGLRCMYCHEPRAPEDKGPLKYDWVCDGCSTLDAPFEGDEEEWED